MGWSLTQTTGASSLAGVGFSTGGGLSTGAAKSKPDELNKIKIRMSDDKKENKIDFFTSFAFLLIFLIKKLAISSRFCY